MLTSVALADAAGFEYVRACDEYIIAMMNLFRRRPPGLAVALGANLPSPAGSPLDTLLAARVGIEKILGDLDMSLEWSPLFRTAPVGGPQDQDYYLNAVVLATSHSESAVGVTQSRAAELLAALQAVEINFGRQRIQRWGPRSLDLDLLWWGELRCRSASLELPHPRLLERAFVLAPLAAINRDLVPPGSRASAAELLEQILLKQSDLGATDPAPAQLAGRPGWPE